MTRHHLQIIFDTFVQECHQKWAEDKMTTPELIKAVGEMGEWLSEQQADLNFIEQSINKGIA